MSNRIDGSVSVLKPAGMSSAQVVSYIKKQLNVSKCGHCGTLDPGASGVLKICIGKATKISDFLMNSAKRYITEFKFGAETDTLDSYGRVNDIDDDFILDSNVLETNIKSFVGEIQQVPPVYSAIKKNGVPLYKAARSGNIVEPESRLVHIYSMNILRTKDNTCLLDIECSKGTYIRSLCRDIACSMGTVGYVSFLHRQFASNTDVSNCHTLEEIDSLCLKDDHSFINTIESELSSLKRIDLADYLFPIVSSGTPVDLSKTSNIHGIDIKKGNAVYCKGKLIGIGRYIDGMIVIKPMLLREGE